MKLHSAGWKQKTFTPHSLFPRAELFFVPDEQEKQLISDVFLPLPLSQFRSSLSLSMSGYV